MNVYQNLLRPSLYGLCLGDAERVHNLALFFLSRKSAPGVIREVVPMVEDRRLHQRVWGLDIHNPVGVAAGIDKHAQVLLALEAFGFGFVTVGGIVPNAQSGNERPRMFYLPKEGALQNYMGFNSPGAAVIVRRLAQVMKSVVQVPVVANLGVNTENALDPEKALEDWVKGLDAVGPWVDVAEINWSSPNTKGLGALVEQAHVIVPALKAQVQVINTALSTDLKLVFKLSGDMDDGLHEATVGAVVDGGGDGISLINTSIKEWENVRSPTNRKGGLSGPPIRERALRVIRKTRALVPDDMPLIGMGGLTEPSDAVSFFAAGATLLATVNGFVVHDPFLAPHINKYLLTHMEREGMSNVTDLQTWRK